MATRTLDEIEPRPLTLADYTTWLRRRWWILALFSVIGVAAAVGLTAQQPRSYTSRTMVVVQPVGLDATPTAKVNLDTEAQFLQSLVVADHARELMGTTISSPELLNAVSVTVPPNSQVLAVAFVAGTPELAQDGSHSFAQALLDIRAADARREVDAALAGLRAQIDDANNKLGDAASRIARAPRDSVDDQRAQADRTVLTQQLSDLNSRLSPLLTAQLVPGSIISDATLPRRPSSPSLQLNVVSGFGAGLLVGILIALLLDRLDTRIRRARDLSERLGISVLLAMVNKKAMGTGLLPSGHPLARELSRLRNVLLTVLPEQPDRGRVVMITSPTPSATAGFLTANLAVAYGRTGVRVAVLTTEPRSPLGAILGCGPDVGLAEVLRRGRSVLPTLSPVPTLPQVRVLLPGDMDADIELPAERILDVMKTLASEYAHVVIETRSSSAALEAQALGSHVDGVVLVAEAGRTRQGDVTEAVRQFEQVGAPLLGAVLLAHVQSDVVKQREPQAADREAQTSGQIVTGSTVHEAPSALEPTVFLQAPGAPSAGVDPGSGTGRLKGGGPEPTCVNGGASATSDVDRQPHDGPTPADGNDDSVAAYDQTPEAQPVNGHAVGQADSRSSVTVRPRPHDHDRDTE